MIVDDEEPVLESFSYILEKGIPDFELCGVARSGSEAIELVPVLKPDLIFMDIQMPGLDGIETIAIIQKQHPNITFILASAYERFDIAQKAIPLGVFNYLVKPISRKALSNEFAKVKMQLDEMRERNDLHLKEAGYAQKMRDELKMNFLLGLAWVNPSERDWVEVARLFSLKGDHGVVLLFKIINPLPDDEIQNAYQSVVHQLQYKSDCLSAIIAGQLILFFHGVDITENIEKLLEKAVESTGKFDYRYGLGSFRRYSALNESYREAFEQLRTLEGKISSAVQQRLEIRDLCEKFLYSDWDVVQLQYEKYWTEIYMSNDFLVAKAKMIAFFVLLMDKLHRDPRIQCEIEIDPAEEIVGLSSIQNWRQWSTYMMERLRFVIKENRDQYYPKPLSLAVNYIKEYYTQPLQLSSVAEQCEISQGYLSRLFSEYLNTTFVDYLNTMRINEASRLLRNGKKTVKEISHIVGYNDPNYFSRIFRRYVNISPSELSKGGLNNEG